jgi:solute carrier family 35 protein F5
MTEPLPLKRNPRSRWTLGLILLTVVVILWVASGFLINSIFESGEYRKPYFVTYLNTGTFTVYLLPTLFRYLNKSTAQHQHSTARNDLDSSVAEEEENGISISSSSSNVPHYVPNVISLKENETGEREGLLTPNSSSSENIVQSILEADVAAAAAENTRQFTVRETAIFSSQFCILWFLANLLSNACLSYTSVSNSTILLSTSSFFTLIIGALFRVETITTQKVLALVVSIVGLYLITVSSAATSDDTNDAVTYSNAWLGNLMALLSAVVYGLYTTLLKVCIGDNESRINMYLFFGFVGLFNIILLWPVITLFNYIGVETFELPGSLHVWVIILVNAATTIISDFCWALAMLMTSPLVVTVGLSATIPLAIAGDMALKSHYDSLSYYLGATIMVAAIFRINRLENAENSRKHEHD